MRHFWSLLFLISFVLLLIGDFVYGAFVFVYPVMFLLCFFLMFGLLIFDAADQEGANPGLEELQGLTFGVASTMLGCNLLMKKLGRNTHFFLQF
jgi:hypothetical protein